MMNWITTNIRLPEDLYMDLKMSAARQRKSVAAVVREKLTDTKVSPKKTKAIFARWEKISRAIRKQNKGINLSEKLIEMRYEQ